MTAEARPPRAGAPRIAISVRAWSGFEAASPEAGMDRYRSAIATLATSLVRQHDAEITFISTCQGVPEYWLDDSEVALQIVASLPAAVAARTSVDRAFRAPDQLIEDLHDFDLVVATRMHMAILALCAGTPVLPIAYEFKTRALFARFGLETLVQPIEDIDPVSLTRCASFVLEERAAVCRTLFPAVAAERESALRSAELVRAALTGEPAREARAPTLPVVAGSSRSA